MPRRRRQTLERQTFAWHGWRLELPREWNPLRIEGDVARGSVLFADLQRHRLALRWSSVRVKGFDPEQWSRAAVAAEAGQLAADDSRPLAQPGQRFRGSRIFLDPKPPGRDIWVGYSPASGRVAELIYHAQRRDRILETEIVPTLADRRGFWSVFDLCCTVPEEMKLTAHQLRAGDLKLSFENVAARRRVSVRQISVARLALTRLPLERWLAKELPLRHYRRAGEDAPVAIRCEDGRELTGLMLPMTRRKRFFFLRRSPQTLVAAALHDVARDRLLLLLADDEMLLRDVARGVGVADRTHPADPAAE